MIQTTNQKKALGNLLQYLSANNEFYSKKIGFNLENKSDDEILNRFYYLKPTTRDEILNNYIACLDLNFVNLFSDKKALLNSIFNMENLSDNFDKTIQFFGKTWNIENTSGTSGRPFPIIKSDKEKLAEAMHLLKSRKMVYKNAKVENGMLLVHKEDEFLKKIDLRGDISELGKVIQYMFQTEPKWIFSSAYIMSRILQYIKICDVPYDFSKLDIQFIETTSQQLLVEEKKDIEDIFHCKMVSNYGCREVWNIGYEEKGDGRFYVNTRTLLVELIDDNGNIITDEGVTGDIIVTSLVHKTLPFVRYYLGDRAKFYYDEDHRLYMQLEEGRKMEKIIGTPFSGTFIFRNVLRSINFRCKIRDIKRIRIIQETENNLEVYIDKDKKNDKYFEKCFISIFYSCIKDYKKFHIKFIYEYPFEESRSLYKQKVYETKCAKQ